ncbi:MAG: allophanate hydrolase subunit 1 [Actinobacteria bacterium]|nr:allophanate hydrolase subunit 1 [Actinomycetota bacterium]
MGDRGLLIRFEGDPSSELTAYLVGMAAKIAAQAGVIDAAPGHRTVLVEGSTETLMEVASKLEDMGPAITPYRGKIHEVPVRYDGPDLSWICEHLELETEEIISLHSRFAFDVHLIGSPGFIYLSEVDERIALPRLDEPRMSVPAGAVGIGGRQTGIYGKSRPGGWRLLGTASNIPDVVPGDKVLFKPA